MRVICLVLIAFFTISACSTSTPTLPPDSPSDVYSWLTSNSADNYLYEVTTYPWDDNGGAAGARFTWIGLDAASADRDAASQAAKSAAVITDFLITDHSDLTSVGSGFLGMTKVSAAELNPLLIRSYSDVLAPYVGQTVRGTDASFDSVRSKVADDPAALRNLLAILVADPEAGRTIAEAADTAAARFEDAAAAAAPDSEESSPTYLRLVHCWALFGGGSACLGRRGLGAHNR